MKSDPIKFKHLLNNSFVKQYVLKEYMRGIRNYLHNLSVASLLESNENSPRSHR